MALVVAVQDSLAMSPQAVVAILVAEVVVTTGRAMSLVTVDMVVAADPTILVPTPVAVLATMMATVKSPLIVSER